MTTITDEQAEILDVNESLTYVRFQDGREDWVAPHEILSQHPATHTAHVVRFEIDAE